MSGQVSSLETAVADKQSEVARLQESLSAAEQRAEALSSDQDALTQCLTRERVVLSEAETELKARLAAAEQSAEDKQGEVAELQDRLQASKHS